MTVTYFVDTNVMVYAASAAPKDKAKRQRAAEIIHAGDFGLSGQVLAEFYTVVTREGDPPMAPTTALAWIDRFALQPCLAIDETLVRRAIDVSVRYQISYWDGAIIAAAEALGAKVVLSEDLNHGQSYGNVRVENPFL